MGEPPTLNPPRKFEKIGTRSKARCPTPQTVDAGRAKGAMEVMKRLLASVLCAAVLGVFASSPALAQGKGNNKDAAAAGDKKKVKNYDFTGDEIDGDLIKPDGDFIDTRGFADYKSLINIRQDFIKEILKSAEDL